MNAQHTPGPWHVVEDGINGDWPRGCEIAIDDDDGDSRDYYLASVVHGDNKHSVDYRAAIEFARVKLMNNP